MIQNHNFLSVEDEGHVLRSRLLDAFVPIEIWADNTLRVLQEKHKASAPLAQKLNAIEKEVKATPSRFMHPDHLGPLLEKLRTASLLRSNIVHAKLVVGLLSDGRQIWMFQNLGSRLGSPLDFQVIFDGSAFQLAIKQLEELHGKLEKQKLKPEPS